MDRELRVAAEPPFSDPAEARRRILQHVRNCQNKECSTCSKVRDQIKLMNDQVRELVDIRCRLGKVSAAVCENDSTRWVNFTHLRMCRRTCKTKTS